MSLNKVESTLPDSEYSVNLVDRWDYAKQILVLRGIEAGAGIELNLEDADGVGGTTQKKIVISTSGEISGETNTASNLGETGEGIYGSKSGSDLRFKRLVAGTNIALSSDSNTITISAEDSVGESNTGSNVGAGAGIYKDKSGTALRFKSLIAGSNLAISPAGDTITIDALTDSISFLGLIDVPDSYTADYFVKVNSGGTAVEFVALAAVASSGDYDDLSNLPSLAAVATSGDYDDLDNKPAIPVNIEDLTNVHVSTMPDDDDVLSWEGGNQKWVPRTLTDLVGISELIEDGTPTLGGNLNLNTYSIISESNADITIAPDGDGAIILDGLNWPTSDGSDGQVLTTDGEGNLSWSSVSSGQTNTASNVGDGVGVYKNKSGVDLVFKSITAGSNKVTITSNTDDVAIDVVEANLTLTNFGGTLSIAKGGTGGGNATDARSNLGLGSIAVQAASSVAITGGTINGVVVGGSTPAAATVTNLTASGTVSLNGLVYPSADGDEDQVLTTDGAGALSWTTVTAPTIVSPSNIIFVAKNGHDSTGNGSIYNPYLTIAKALTEASENDVIAIYPGTYTEDLEIPEDGVSLVGFGSGPNNRTVITGELTISVANATLSNISMTNSADKCLQLFDSGTVLVSDCSFTRTANTDAIRIDGAMTGHAIFENVTVVGSVVNSNTASGYNVVIRHSRSSTMTVQGLTANSRTYVEDCTEIGWVRHDAGIMSLSSVGRVVENSSGYAIESSASVSGHHLLINEVNFLQSDGTYGLINKTANSHYSITDSNHDWDNDVLTGTSLGFGRFATDISSAHTAVNYTAANASITAHLAGIDTALASVVDSIQGLEDDTSPVLGGNLDVDGNSIISSDGDVIIAPEDNLRVTGPVAISGGNFSVYGDARSFMAVMRNSTSNATQTELFLDGSSERLVVPADTTWAFHIHLVARRTDEDGESAAFLMDGCIDNNAGTTALVGTVSTTVLARDSVAWTVTAIADDTSENLKILVTGEAAKTIRWVAFITIIEVTG